MSGLVLLLGLQWYWYKPARQIKRWRRSLDLERHKRAFDRLYADVDGFSLSRSDRQHGDAPEYVYGEIDFESFIALLSLCQVGSDTVFYDLGSGSGKAVIACAMVFDVKKSCGVELLPLLHQCAEKQGQRLTALPAYAHLKSHIVFEHSDLLNTSLSDASLIFINATAFFAGHWQCISQHLQQVKPGTLIITTSKALSPGPFITHKVTPVQMSWGVVSAFIQQRVSGNEIAFSAT